MKANILKTHRKFSIDSALIFFYISLNIYCTILTSLAPLLVAVCPMLYILKPLVV